MFNLEDVLSKLVYSNVSQTGGGFRKFLEKKAVLIPLDNISPVFTAI